MSAAAVATPPASALPTTNGAAAPPPSLTGTIHKGIVKNVISCDTLVIRGQPRNGPPPEKTICIGGIQAPRLGRRPVEGGAAETKDEPFAWEAREYVRKRVIGKEITFVLGYKTTTDREYGQVFVGPSTNGENIAEGLVAEGLVEVRAGNRTDDISTKLSELQAAAQATKKGRWGVDPENGMAKHIRNIEWSQENLRNFVDAKKQEPIDAVIEQVRDGSTVRAFLLPDFQYVTVMMSGIKCPSIILGKGGMIESQDPFAQEAKYFTEVRLLQRDVKIVLESCSNANFLGSIIHPAGNIAELLLKEGYAKCVDWSIALSTAGPEKLRAAETIAKSKQLRVWKGFKPSENTDKKTFNAKVIEIINGDAMMIKKDNGAVEKIWLASVRPPRIEDATPGSAPGAKEGGSGPGRPSFRPLYDIPFMFDAREFLRKRLIGKRVSVSVDYIQPGNDQYPPRTCATVVANSQNVAEALIAKGLGTVVRYRQGDDNRSSKYDALLAAEAKAEKTAKGIHSLKGANKPDKILTVRIQDLQGDAAKSRSFLPHLTRVGHCEGVVEFLASGSRLRVYIPKETCIVTILLSGINCPRADRQLASGLQKGEPFGNDALVFIKEKCMQREVDLEVETCDKSGSFIGWVTCEGQNLAVELVREGLASVHHYSACQSRFYSALCSAEEEAKKKGAKIWASYSEEENQKKAEAAANEQTDRRMNFREVCITGINPDNKLTLQYIDEGPKLERMMKELRLELEENPPVTGSYTPRRGDVCAAKFSEDNLWYRARVEEVPRGTSTANILFIDFGNREKANFTSLAALPATFQGVAAGAKEYGLALLQWPEDPDYTGQGTQFLGAEISAALAAGAKLKVNPEYRVANAEFVTLIREDTPKASGSSENGTDKDGSKTDIGKLIVENGLALVDMRKEKRLSKMVNEYAEAQEKAKRGRRNLWEYGDFTGTDM